MQRKPGFPVANCSIKMPDNSPMSDMVDEEEPNQRRQNLINFGHTQWGFNNWSWAVSKQDLDFVDLVCGKYTAGVAAFVTITVKTFEIHRENVGYATCIASTKGSAIHQARKCAVTNALRETLLSFGGSVGAELLEMDRAERSSEPLPENNPNLANVINHVPKPPSTEPKNSPLHRKESDCGGAAVRAGGPVVPVAPAPPAVKNAMGPGAPPPAPPAPPVAKAHPMPANLPPAANRPPPAAAPRAAPPAAPHAPHARPASNVSFMVPMVGGVVPPVYAPPRLPPPPQLFPNAYYEYAGPWHFTYEPHGNVNLNFNMPPKNLVVNGRAGSVECKNACGRDADGGQYAANRGCWIKPSIFYDGFWTEQKVKKWVAEQVEKQFPPEPAVAPDVPAAKP